MSASSDYQQLRELLLSPEVSALRSIEDEVGTLKRLLEDPDKLARLLHPVFAEMLLRGDPAIARAIATAITPVIDRVVRDKTREDTSGMSDAIAPASTAAIALHYAEAPQEAAQDLAPLVSGAIKEQIRGERDAMIDVLYPIIGSTISKYLSQTLSDLIQTINTKIESNFTFKGLSRKIRARMAGVSEAELLLRDSLTVRIEAALLIHKASGLIIAQSQSPDSPALDPDLLSGMLTAIRSLFNDSMDSVQTARELDQIEYGEWKIVLESAGHCYLAAIVRGIPNESLRISMRETLASIVQRQAEAVESYTGDRSKVPEEIPRAVSTLVQHAHVQAPAPSPRRKPYAFVAACVLLLLLLSIPLALRISRDAEDRDVEARAAALLRSAPPSPVNGISVNADREIIRLSGMAPNEHQRTTAVSVIAAAFPGHQLENQINTAPSPPLEVFVARRVEETAATLSTINGVFLNAALRDGRLAVTGFIPDSTLRQPVINAFADLPGIRTFECRIAEGTPEPAVRIYFESNSALVRRAQLPALADIEELLTQAPWAQIRIIGHSDPKGSELQNRALAHRRAESVERALVALGFPRNRFVIEGIEGPPPGAARTDPDSLGRCVRFSLLQEQSAKPR